MQATKRKKRIKWKDELFYYLILLFPIAQFAVFYLGVNINSLMLAFQTVDGEGVRTWSFLTMQNSFREMFSDVTMVKMWGNSLKSYFLINIFSVPLGLTFSYYIYRKLPMSGFMRVLLFMPSIISAIIMVTIFHYFSNDAIPAIVNGIFGEGTMSTGLIDNEKTRYGMIIFYNIWVSFGVSVLMYSNAMSGISPDIVEAAHLDGATGLREFWSIVLPSIFPTLTTFLIVGVAGIFTNQIQLFAFFAGQADSDIHTFGYYLFVKANELKKVSLNNAYAELASKGVILTVIIVPITYLVKYVLEKFGPRED